MSKAELYSLYVSLERTNTPSKTSRARKNKTSHVSDTSSSSRSSSSSPLSKRINKPSASRGRASDSALPDHSSAQPVAAALSSTALPAVSRVNVTHYPFCTLPASNLALAADASVRMPPLAPQAQLPYHFPSTSAPFFSQWPAAPTVDAGSGQYQPAMQAN